MKSLTGGNPMAAKTLIEAIQRALTIGPLNQVEERLTKELRDFFAHEVHRYEHHLMNADEHRTTQICDIESRTQGALELFQRVFKDISATPEAKPTNPEFFIVKVMQDVTATDTFRCDDPGHQCTEDCLPSTNELYSESFATEEEAMKFYNRQKNSLRFAGVAGQYVTYPLKQGGGK
jgi:hypothetical protein